MKRSKIRTDHRPLRRPLLASVLCLMQLVAMPAANAQEPKCDAPQTQLEMNICAQRDFETADATLNTQYAKARAAMKSIDSNLPSASKGAAEALLQAQRAWIAYRDLACEAEGYLVKGGTMEPLIVSTCKARLTEQRTNDLRQLIEAS